MSPFSHFPSTDLLMLIFAYKSPAVFAVFVVELSFTEASLPDCNSTQ